MIYEKELNLLRYLIFLLCFALSYSVWLFVHDVKKLPIAETTKIAGLPPRTFPLTTFPEGAPEIDRKWTDLEYTGNRSLWRNGYKITNTEKGLSISKKGKRLVFLKNAFTEGEFGYFGFRSLLRKGANQLVYLSRTGGNHCCVYFQIVDLSSKLPRKIFNSEDYDVQRGEVDSDSLMTFDRENDGRLEITQKTTYSLSMDCPEAANPVSYVGFAYSERLERYVPMTKFAPGVEVAVSERKLDIERDNEKILNNQRPETIGCVYEADVTAIALSYIYTGHEQQGFEYIRRNYQTLDISSSGFRFDKQFSKRMALKKILELKKGLVDDKLYRAIYGR